MDLLMASLFALLVAATLREEQTKGKAVRLVSGFAAVGALFMAARDIW